MLGFASPTLLELKHAVVLGEPNWMRVARIHGRSSTPPKVPITAEQMCVLDRAEPWVQIPVAPDVADQLVALADASPRLSEQVCAVANSELVPLR